MKCTLKTKQESEHTPLQSCQNYKITSLMHLPLAIFRTMGTPKIIVTIIDSTTLNEIIHNHEKLKEGKGRKTGKPSYLKSTN